VRLKALPLVQGELEYVMKQIDLMIATLVFYFRHLPLISEAKLVEMLEVNWFTARYTIYSECPTGIM
jgi:hypothetical protein